MSTKIYNGYQIKEMSMPELLLLIQRVQDALLPVHEKLYMTQFVREALRIIDGKVLLIPEKFAAMAASGSKGCEVTPYFYANSVIRNAQKEIKISQIRDPLYDFGCEIVVLPLSQGKILAILYTEKKAFTDIVESFPEIEPYPYYNDTDEPEDITLEEWDARGQEWEKALNKDIPSLCGFTVSLTLDNLVTPSREKILECLPSFEERVNTHAYNRCVLKILEEQKTEMVQFISAYNRASAFVKTEEGKKMFEDTKFEVAALLKPEITFDDFFVSVPIPSL